MEQKKPNKIKKILKIILLTFVIIFSLLFVLIGILISSLDIPMIFPPPDRIKLKADAAKLQGALANYQFEFERIPSEEQGLRALIEKPTSGFIPKNYKPIIKNKDAILDPWKTEYKLKIDSSGDYAIITLGKDKKEGGEGKDKDFNILNDDEYPKDIQ